MKDQIREEVSVQMNSAIGTLTAVINDIRKRNDDSNERIETLIREHMKEDTETHRQQQEFFETVRPILENYQSAAEMSRVGGKISAWLFKKIIPAILALLALWAGIKSLNN